MVNRGVPSKLGKPVIDHTREWTKRSVTLRFRPDLADPEIPVLIETRATISRALAKVRELEDRINDFLPRWAEHVGFELKIDGVAVSIGQQMTPTFVIPGAPGTIVPGKPRKETLHFRGTARIRR